MARYILVLLLACLLMIGNSPTLAQNDSPSDDERRLVLVANQDIPRGTILTRETLYGAAALIEAQSWPATLAPQTALRDLTALEGRVVALDLTPGMPILAGNIVDTLPESAAIGADAALLLPPNTLGLPLLVSRLAYAPPTMDVLDCVTVEGVFNFGGVSSRYRVPLGLPSIVIEGVLGSGLVTLALDPETAATVAWAQAIGLDFWLDFAPPEDCPIL